MSEPKILRPQFPEGYLENPKSLLTWQEVETRLGNAINYWVCTTQPNGHPHVVPKWGVWVGRQFYFDGSPETKHARNMKVNPNMAVHLESGDEVVIVYGAGTAVAKPEADVAVTVARLYGEKYRDLGYAPEPTQWDAGGLFVFTAQKVLAWTKFTDDPTKFIFDEENK